VVKKLMRSSQTDKVTVILTTLCVLTGAGAWYTEIPALRGRDTGAPSINTPNGGDRLATRIDRASDRTKATIDHYTAILDRPLFSSSRRPATARIADKLDDAPPSRPVPTRDAEFKLVGIMIIEEKRFALLQTVNGKVTRRIEVGDEINGWRVTAVTPDSVTLNRGVMPKTLGLERKSDPKSTAKAERLAKIRRAQLKKRAAVRGARESVTPDRVQSSKNDGKESPASDANDDE
jgi:hypothetical protein